MTTNIFARLFKVFLTGEYWLCEAGFISDPLFMVSDGTLGVPAIKNSALLYNTGTLSQQKVLLSSHVSRGAHT